MKKNISVLQKTTRHAGIGLVVFGLIVVAAPVAVFADPEIPQQIVQGVDEGHKIDICHFEDNGSAQILNIDENGWNGHQNHDGDFKINDQDESSSNDSEDCVSKLPPPIVDVCLNIPEIQSEVPEGYTVNSDHLCTPIEQEAACTFGSDTTTVVGTSPAVASFVHSAWTHALESTGIMWIWNAAFATPSDTVDEVVTFTKSFNVVGTPGSVKLDLAADNYYTVSVNGTSACAAGADLDNFSSVEPQCDITSLVHTGVNTLTFVVTNAKGYGTNPETNPGGLIYKVTIDGASCAPVPPPVENSCVAPVPTEGPAHVVIGANPNEPTLQSILTSASYTLNVDTDQVNAQSWSGTNNTVHFSVKAISKNAGHSHVFGYKVNGGAFVGVFRDGTVTNPSYSGLPLKDVGADGSVTFDVNGVNDIVFAIYDDATNTFFYTKKASNADTANHAVVYNPNSNEYVIGFEDVTNGDGDMNDLVVSVTITGCEENPTTATIHAQKVVCTDEKELPNWGAGAADITATTATDWVAEHKSCSLVPWDFQWAPSDTSNPGDNTVGLPAGWSAFVSGVASIPAGARAWVRENINTDYIPFTGPNAENNVSAELYCSNDVLNYDNFDFIDPVVAGQNYYCVGFNAPKDQEVTNTASTIVVKFANLETETNLALAVTNNSGKWFYYNDTTDVINNALGSFVTGPAVAPIGTGSSEMTDPDATGRIDIATFAFSGVKLADIKTLAFSSYSHSGISGPTESPYLVFNVSFDGTDSWQKRLVYVPANNGAVPQDVWNTNDTIQAGAGKWVYSGATWPVTGEPGTTAKTWTQILSDYPAAKILPTGGLMGIRVGEPGPAGYTGNVDKFVIGIKTGSNIDTRTYDFESSPVCSDGKDNDQDEAIDAADPGCHSDGNTSNSESYTPNGDSEVNTVVIDTAPKPVCSDGSDNDGDTLIDSADPGCHTDGNAGNAGSYNPSGTSETNVTTFSRTSRSSGGGGGRVLGASTGQVLGESCGLYMERHLRLGSKKNDANQTKKLQTFLNKWMGSTLPVSGFYGPQTVKVLNAFQAKYADDILVPWNIKGPTGLVYFTTLHKINELECPEAAGDKPTNLIDWSKNPTAQ